MINRSVAENRALTNSHADAPQFAPQDLLIDLKGKTISSGFVTGMAQAAQIGLELLSIVVLSRLLVPQDFGLVAMVITLMGFLRLFTDGGLSTATVQREDITHAQVSNLFWMNVALGAGMGVLLAVSAPVIAWFYREPRLVAVCLILSVTFVLSGSTVQHMALLNRQMRFTKVALIRVGSVASGVLVGVVMAWRNFGYWSLVGMHLTRPLIVFLLTWFSSTWRPQRPVRRSGTRFMLGFGANLTASSFIWSVARGMDGVLIGRLYGAASLGLYTRASTLLIRPVQQFVTPLEAVFIPTLSRLTAHPERYRRVVLKVFEVVAMTSFFFTGLSLALAEPLTLVVLGPNWGEAAPIFAGFTLAALFTPIGSVASWLLTSQGRGEDFMRCSVFGSTVAVLSFLAGLPFGPVGVALAYSASALFIFLPFDYYVAGRHGPVSAKDLWTTLLRHLPLWAVVCGATWLTHRLVADWVPLAQLATCVPVAFLAGAVFVSLYGPSRRTAWSAIAAIWEWKKTGVNALKESVEMR